MTQPNLDLDKLKEVCPELVEPMREVTEVIRHFKTSPSWQRSRGLDELLNKTELRLTFSEVQAIAATMLNLTEENEEMHPKANAYDLACATEKECRLPKNIDIIGRKGDPDEK